MEQIIYESCLYRQIYYDITNEIVDVYNIFNYLKKFQGQANNILSTQIYIYEDNDSSTEIRKINKNIMDKETFILRSYVNKNILSNNEEIIKRLMNINLQHAIHTRENNKGQFIKPKSFCEFLKQIYCRIDCKINDNIIIDIDDLIKKMRTQTDYYNIIFHKIFGTDISFEQLDDFEILFNDGTTITIYFCSKENYYVINIIK